MNILFITPTIPSRLHRIRAYQLIKYLSQRHKVTLLSLQPPAQENYSLVDIGKYCHEVHIIPHSWPELSLNCTASLLTTSIPLEVAYCQSKKMRSLICELTARKRYDLLYVKRLRMVPNVLEVRDIPIIIDTTDAVSMYYREAMKTVPLYKKPLYLNEGYKYKRYEAMSLRHLKMWVTCSSLDRSYLKRFAPEATRIEVVPNGIDTSYYCFQGSRQRSNNPQVLFSGLMNKHVNTSAVHFFVEYIFPLVREWVPEAHLLIVGPKPTLSVRRLKTHPSITVTGYVADLREYIARSNVVVCPMRTGTGTRNKILQAWALGKPVVSTTVGASGLEYEAGEDLLVADSAHSFAVQVVRLLEDPVLCQHLAAKARQHVVSTYSMEVVMNTLESVLEKVQLDSKTLRR